MSRMRWGAAIALIFVVGCGRAEFTFGKARKVFEDTLTERYPNQFRLINWNTTNILLTISEPSDFMTYSVAYELECLSTIDITQLMWRRTNSGMPLTHGYEKTDSGYRIADIPVKQVMCAPGQKISFKGWATPGANLNSEISRIPLGETHSRTLQFRSGNMIKNNSLHGYRRPAQRAMCGSARLMGQTDRKSDSGP